MKTFGWSYSVMIMFNIFSFRSFSTRALGRGSMRDPLSFYNNWEVAEFTIPTLAGKTWTSYLSCSAIKIAKRPFTLMHCFSVPLRSHQGISLMPALMGSELFSTRGFFKWGGPLFFVFVHVICLPKIMYSVDNLILGEEGVLCFKGNLRSNPRAF